MTHRRLLFAVFVLLSLVLAGCAPPWAIVGQAVPNPFLGQRKFAVAPTDYNEMRVGLKTEADYLGEKDDKQRASFASDKEAANAAFTNALISQASSAGIAIVLATGPGDAPFFLRPAVTHFEPGFYAGVVSGASRMDVTLKITTPDGQVLDEILLAHRSAAPTMGGNGGVIAALSNIDKMSSGGRMKADGEWIGKTSAKYLITRVAPQ